MLLKGTTEKFVSQKGGFPYNIFGSLMKIGLLLMKMYLHCYLKQFYYLRQPR